MKVAYVVYPDFTALDRHAFGALLAKPGAGLGAQHDLPRRN